MLLVHTVGTRRDTLCCGADGRGRFHVTLLKTGGKPSVITEKAVCDELEVFRLLITGVKGGCIFEQNLENIF